MITFLDVSPEYPSQSIQNLIEELQRLKKEQDEKMLLAVYVGMTRDEAKLHDERRQRIYELYEILLARKGSAT